MNGRMYDAKLGRFLSPDNFVTSVFDTQSYNRYSYVLNNPLMYSDPSGETKVTFLLWVAAYVLMAITAGIAAVGIVAASIWVTQNTIFILGILTFAVATYGTIVTLGWVFGKTLQGIRWLDNEIYGSTLESLANNNTNALGNLSSIKHKSYLAKKPVNNLSLQYNYKYNIIE